MADDGAGQVSGSDIAAVSQKLKVFHDSLPSGEQLVVDWLLWRAAQAPGTSGLEVEGYAQFDAFKPGSAFNLNPALGLGGGLLDPSTKYAHDMQIKNQGR